MPSVHIKYDKQSVWKPFFTDILYFVTDLLDLKAHKRKL